MNKHITSIITSIIPLYQHYSYGVFDIIQIPSLSLSENHFTVNRSNRSTCGVIWWLLDRLLWSSHSMMNIDIVGRRSILTHIYSHISWEVVCNVYNAFQTTPLMAFMEYIILQCPLACAGLHPHIIICILKRVKRSSHCAAHCIGLYQFEWCANKEHWTSALHCDHYKWNLIHYLFA